MSLAQILTSYITLEEYEGLPEDVKMEVINGEVYDKASPNQIHQEISIELSAQIRNLIKSNKSGCSAFHAPFDVKLEDDPLTIVQPDILIVCDKDKLDGKRCNGAPDFIIEIISPGTSSYDYVTKLNLYYDYGVREYWIIDPAEGKIAVYNFTGENMKLNMYTFQDKIKVNIFEDFYIDFTELNI